MRAEDRLGPRQRAHVIAHRQCGDLLLLRGIRRAVVEQDHRVVGGKRGEKRRAFEPVQDRLDRALLERIDRLRLGEDPQPVEARIRIDGAQGLVGLRLLVLRRHALHAQPDGNLHGLAGLEREGEIREGRDPWARPVIQQPRQSAQRFGLLRSTQVRLVGVAFLIERDDVEKRRPQIDDRYGVVVALARCETRKLRRSRDRIEHRFTEAAERAHPIGDGGEAGSIADRHRRQRRVRRAAAAGVAHSLPPRIVILSTPRSMKFGSLSSRAICQGPTGMTPRASSPLSGWPNGTKRVTTTESTPSTLCTAW